MTTENDIDKEIYVDANILVSLTNGADNFNPIWLTPYEIMN